MLRRDVYTPTVANLLQPKLRYLGDKSSLLSMEMLKEVYVLAAVNLKRVGNKVLLRNHKKHTLYAKDMPNQEFVKLSMTVHMTYMIQQVMFNMLL